MTDIDDSYLFNDIIKMTPMTLLFSKYSVVYNNRV